tara:strand:+ start:75 stop:239 length:165 start_codon:yes stop_codon:yes gene_type:complete
MRVGNNHALPELEAMTPPSVRYAVKCQKWDATLHVPAAVEKNIRNVMEPELMDL